MPRSREGESVVFFKKRGLASVVFGLPCEAAGRAWMGKERELPCTDFWNWTWGLGQSAEQSSGGPILVLECAYDLTEPSEMYLFALKFSFKSFYRDVKHIDKKASQTKLCRSVEM